MREAASWSIGQKRYWATHSVKGSCQENVIMNDSIASINEDWIKTGDYSNSSDNENEMKRKEVATALCG
jgi:hypothetical protein